MKISAYSAIMPDYKWVFSFHSIFIKEQFGKINSPEAYEEAVAKVKEYNGKHEEVLCTIEQLDDGEVIVAVCDQLSKRVHQVLPQSGDIVLMQHRLYPALAALPPTLQSSGFAVPHWPLPP